MTDTEGQPPVEPRPPDDHGRLPDDHPIMDELRRAGEIVARINEGRRRRGDTQS